jgi:hypothetical protein
MAKVCIFSSRSKSVFTSAIQYTKPTEKCKKDPGGCKYLGMLTFIVTNTSFAVSLVTK